MSSTNRGARRRDQDVYETPESVAWVAATNIVTWGDWELLVDAGAGDGRLVQHVVREREKAGFDRFLEVVPVDVRRPPELGGPGWWWVFADYLQWVQDGHLATRIARGPALVISNPPFSLADEFVMHTVNALAQDGKPHCALFLLRLNWLGSRKRAAWLKFNPPRMIMPLVPRPSFTGGGQDSCEYAWIGWFVREPGPHVPHFAVGAHLPRGGKT